jgi:hypothetical protein
MKRHLENLGLEGHTAPKETGFKGAAWIHLAQETVKWPQPLNKVATIRVRQGNSWLSKTLFDCHEGLYTCSWWY